MERDNDPKSLEWEPIGEVCGTDAWNGSPAFIAPINGRTRKRNRDSAVYYAKRVFTDYESRRIFEDGIGYIKWAARHAKLKNGLDVIDVARPLLESGEPVKMRAAFEILEWFIEGRVDNEL